MSELPEQEINDILGIMKAEARNQRVLSLLLSNLHARKSHHLVLQARMGEIPSYLASVTLQWVREKVRFAAELPVFPGPADRSAGPETGSSGRSLWTAGTMERIQPRQPDWQRQHELVVYLATNRHHKFPPLLLVGYQPWICENSHDRWGVNGEAMDDSLNLSGLEPTGTIWDMDETETLFYAFDGQHRLMAILGLHDLIQTGQLQTPDRNGVPGKNGGLSRDDVVDQVHGETGEPRNRVRERLQRLMDESIGVEIIPAVCQGETYARALRRLGRTLVDVSQDVGQAAGNQTV